MICCKIIDGSIFYIYEVKTECHVIIIEFYSNTWCF